MSDQTAERNRKNGLILTLFVLSAAIGFTLVTISVWGDYEATMIDITYMGEKNLNTLSCPILITPQDEGEFSAKIHNPLEHNINTNIHVLVSSGSKTNLKEDRVRLRLEPAESRSLTWPIDPADAVYGKLILAKVYQFRSPPIPAKDATCGIYILNWPMVSGRQLVYSGLGFSLIGMAVGAYLWQGNNRLKNQLQKELSRSIRLMAGTITVGLVASLLGSRLVYGWLLGGSSLVVAALLLVVTIYQVLKLEI